MSLQNHLVNFKLEPLVPKQFSVALYYESKYLSLTALQTVDYVCNFVKVIEKLRF